MTVTRPTDDNNYPLRSELLAAWLLMHAILIVSLLTYHVSAVPTIADRYSAIFTLVLIVITIWAIGSSLILIRLARLSDQRFAALLGNFNQLRARPIFRIIAIILVALGTTWYWLRFPDILEDVPHPYLRFCLTIAIFVTLYVMLFWRASDPLIGWGWWVILGAIAFFVALLVSIKYNGHYPTMDTLDEIHNYIVEWTYVHFGLLGDWTWREMVPIPQALYENPLRAIGLLMRMMGDGFWQARLIRLMLACLSLPFIYNSGKILYGKRTGLLAVAAGLIYLIATNYARPDFGVGLMLSIGLYVYLKATQTKHPMIGWLKRHVHIAVTERQFSLALHFLTGLTLGLAVEGHLLAYRFGIAFGLIYATSWLYRMWQQRRIFLDGRIVMLAIGAGLAAALYVAVHILPDTKQAFHFLGGYSPATRDATDQLQAALDIVRRQVEVWLETSPIEFWLFLPALIMAIIRFNRGDRIILTLILVSELLLVSSYAYYRAFYQVHYLPLVALLIGKTLADGFDLTEHIKPDRAKLSQWIFAGLILFLTLSVLIDDAGAALQSPDAVVRTEFESIGTQLANTLPPGLTVIANEDYFVQLVNHSSFYSIQTIASPNWFIPTVQDYALYQQLKPDVIILSVVPCQGCNQIDIPKYIPYGAIYSYMQDNNFHQVRCYTLTGLIEAEVWIRQPIPGWKADPTCHSYAAN